MANRERGELGFECGERRFVLKYSVNALCELEDALGMSIRQFASLFKEPEGIRLKQVRAAMWAGLLEKQPGVTQQQAGTIIEEITMMKAMDLVGQAMQAAFGSSSSGAEEAEGDEDPRRGRGGRARGRSGASATSTQNDSGP